MTTTEYESKRPPAHFLTDTVCGMLAFDGKPYTLSIEQQVAWDERFAKLVSRHGEDKTLDLLREYFETNRLKKSSRPNEFADFVARSTGGGYTPKHSDAWNSACDRVRQHAKAASGSRWPDGYCMALMTECRNDLVFSIMPTDDELRERVRPQARARAKDLMVEVWGKDKVDRWISWRSDSIRKVREGGYKIPRLGGTDERNDGQGYREHGGRRIGSERP